jgi:hypothetical protein
MIINYYPHRDFNKQQWLKNKETRYEYSKDIIESNILIGKTKAQVISILGDAGNLNTDDTWYYGLGYKPELFNIDPSSLAINFKNGKVVNVEQHDG